MARGTGKFFINARFQMRLVLPSVIMVAVMGIMFFGATSMIQYAGHEYLARSGATSVALQRFITETDHVLTTVSALSSTDR